MSGGFKRSGAFGLVGVFVVAALAIALMLSSSVWFATVTGPTATFTHPDGHRETLHATRGSHQSQELYG